MTHLYSCKEEIDIHSVRRFRVTKFDSDFNVEASYVTDRQECNCPAGVRPSCRHRQMLTKFILRNAVNSTWFYDYDRDGWVHMDLGERAADEELEPPCDNGSVEPPCDNVDAPLPKGITVLNLEETSMDTLWNTIADAVGEPRPKLNRRGF